MTVPRLQILDLQTLTRKQLKLKPPNIAIVVPSGKRYPLGNVIDSIVGQGIVAGGEYLGVMRRDALKILAAGRRHRLRDNAPPKLDLTAKEIERSAGTAMRLAEASRSQAEARASADTTRPT